MSDLKIGVGNNISPIDKAADNSTTEPTNAADLIPESSAGISEISDEIETLGVPQQFEISQMPAELNQADLISSVNQGLSVLDESHEELLKGFDQMSASYQDFSSAVSQVAKLVTDGDSSDNLLNATKQMQETQMSFNLQYLQLQSAMQNESRQYTELSNIMKTKHHTVKNSISNVR